MPKCRIIVGVQVIYDPELTIIAGKASQPIVSKNGGMIEIDVKDFKTSENIRVLAETALEVTVAGLEAMIGNKPKKELTKPEKGDIITP